VDPEAVSVPMMAPALPDKRTAIPAVFEVRARQCHRGEMLRGQRGALDRALSPPLRFSIKGDEPQCTIHCVTRLHAGTRAKVLLRTVGLTWQHIRDSGCNYCISEIISSQQRQ